MSVQARRGVFKSPRGDSYAFQPKGEGNARGSHSLRGKGKWGIPSTHQPPPPPPRDTLKARTAPCVAQMILNGHRWWIQEDGRGKNAQGKERKGGHTCHAEGNTSLTARQDKARLRRNERHMRHLFFPEHNKQNASDVCESETRVMTLMTLMSLSCVCKCKYTVKWIELSVF